MAAAEGPADEKFEGWAIVELMGHRRMAGLCREVTIAGAGFLRVDVPAAGGVDYMTQMYAPAAVYAITPTTEAIARAVAAKSAAPPVHPLELRGMGLLPEGGPAAVRGTGDDGW